MAAEEPVLQAQVEDVEATAAEHVLGLVEDIEIFRWEYKDRATIDLVASYGMDVEIRLENHQENGGWAAIATFYGRSEDEA